MRTTPTGRAALTPVPPSRFRRSPSLPATQRPGHSSCVQLGHTRRHARRLIVSDSRVLGGKPRVRGTRLSVEFLLELAASVATRDEILVRYPQLTGDGVA